MLSWHISKELIKNLKRKGYKGKFIIPLPSPKIENYPTTNLNKYNKEINNFYFVYEIMEEYFKNFKQLLNNHEKIMTEYKSRLLYLGSNINLKIDEQNVKQGIFHNLNPDGSITLKNNINFENIYNARII